MNKEEGHTDWDYRRDIPAIWDDWPGDGPKEGPVNCCGCYLKQLSQQYEVCAIGIRKGAGAIRENLGCMQYSHKCVGRVGPHLSPGGMGCYYRCDVQRTPSEVGIIPTAQQRFGNDISDI